MNGDSQLCWVANTMGLMLGATSLLPPIAVTAQVVPDDTLGSERSRVVNRSPVDLEIDGGAARGENLFHSFRTLNVRNGESVYFLNLLGTRNITTRVTGNVRSEISGTLGIRGGDANLFLMNPSGILFGENSRLDIQGYFIGTTANAFQFGDRDLFSATRRSTRSAVLTLRDILELKLAESSGIRLAILSACKTGLPGIV